MLGSKEPGMVNSNRFQPLVPLPVHEEGPMGYGDWGYFLLIVAQHMGVGGLVACEDPGMIGFLASEGLAPDPTSPVAWASDRDQTRTFARA